MEIVEFDSSLTEEWDAFVGRHPLAGYGHLSANFALAAETPGLRNVSLILRDGRATAAVLPLFEQTDRTLRSIRVRELVSGAFFPGGPLFSPTLQGKAEQAALTRLADGVRERARAFRADAVTITYPNITGGEPTSVRLGYSPLLHHGYHARPGVGLMLDLTRPPEQLAAGRKSGCRQSIAKAQAAGAAVSVIRERDEWMRCHALNAATLGELAYSERQLAAMWDHFIVPGHAAAYGVSMNGVLHAVTVIVQSKGSAYYWQGWRSQAAMSGSPHLGLWSAILASREHGCPAFELGSLAFEHAKQMGISQFKQSFGGMPFQTLSATLDMKPVKSAALALASAAIAAIRRRRSVAPPPATIVQKQEPPARVGTEANAHASLAARGHTIAAVPTTGKH